MCCTPDQGYRYGVTHLTRGSKPGNWRLWREGPGQCTHQTTCLVQLCEWHFYNLVKYAIQDFTDYINSQSEHIKFTIEAEQDGQLPFLHTLVIVNDDSTLKTKLYCKPTHTDQYLNWDANQHLGHKRSVVCILLCRDAKVVSEMEDVKEEVKHMKKVLTWKENKKWSFQIPKMKVWDQDKQRECPTANKHPVCIPNISGLLEQLQRVFRSYGIPSYHKPVNTIRPLLVSHTDI